MTATFVLTIESVGVQYLFTEQSPIDQYFSLLN